MDRSRGTSRARLVSMRNLARVALAGAVVAGSSFGLGGTAFAASDDVWDQIAQCESGGNWSTNTGNGYSGGLQFTPSTWHAFGGSGSPANASRAEQIAVANRVLAAQGWSAWPVCSRNAGVRGTSTSSPASSTSQTSATRSTQTGIK